MSEQSSEDWGLTDEELASVYAVPAVTSNRVIASVFPNGMRLAFGEIGVGRTVPLDWLRRGQSLRQDAPKPLVGDPQTAQWTW